MIPTDLNGEFDLKPSSLLGGFFSTILLENLSNGATPFRADITCADAGGVSPPHV